ncbi:MAG: hypothetical protein G01um101419_462 [Parcubacteria group bacterium Gr01-1014_19]|nr:MAG: hypothetical protein G01um101419_462 [Parcubacteria group bacterium Gr01-1014_19]
MIKKILVLLAAGVVVASVAGVGVRYVLESSRQPESLVLATACNADFRDVEGRQIVGSNLLKLSAPSIWEQQQPNPDFDERVLHFLYRGDPRRDSAKLNARFVINTSREFLDDPFDPKGVKATLDALGKIYDKRSLAGVGDKESLEIPIGPIAQIILPGSYEYLESSDGAWRGYYYITLYVTQDADRHEPYAQFILFNKNSVGSPVLSGTVDLETSERLSLDQRLDNYFKNDSQKDSDNKLYELINKDIGAANQAIRDGRITKEFACQLDNFKSVIKSIKVTQK